MLIFDRIKLLLPGLALTAVVSLVAQIGEKVELGLFGHPWIEGLVLAILLGTAYRSIFGLPDKFDAGVTFSAKTILEVAIVLLGASISVEALKGAGFYLVGGIVLVVCLSLVVSYSIGRALGLPARLAILVACGNSICGNSAIAATAPVINADAEDVAASIAFTAVLGVVFVLILPFLQHALGMSATQYGVFAGLTVYAVPQVLAATAPAGLVATQIGTLVKLVRVLMLGPVICTLGLGARRQMARSHAARMQSNNVAFTGTGATTAEGAVAGNGDITDERQDDAELAVKEGLGAGVPLSKLLPWFIVGFLAMMTLRSIGMLPDAAVIPMQHVSSILTVMAMAALGLSVDVRSVMNAGGRVIFAAKLSLVCLSLAAFGLLAVLQIV
ncbi:YeiH family protein [uncultured Thalassospira sp.]|uniref:YeiH family protein n=1 Tax=uncultured Thalassospira sp. TaxID=404382 RepID=UPI0030D75AD3|tara:strand:- start:782 stop:1939 length:1158 start_codon:yes stop_codon:yes gene_type:complete